MQVPGAVLEETTPALLVPGAGQTAPRKILLRPAATGWEVQS